MLVILLIIGYIVLERTYFHPLRMPVKRASELIASGDINRVVDVRTKMEWDRGHLPSAIHLPMSKLTDENTRLHLDQADNILVYCNSGTRARQAALRLKELGYPLVHYIAETYHEL